MNVFKSLARQFNKLCYAKAYHAADGLGHCLSGYRYLDAANSLYREDTKPALIFDQEKFFNGASRTAMVTLIHAVDGSFVKQRISMSDMLNEFRNYAISNYLQIEELADARTPQQQERARELFQRRGDIEQTAIKMQQITGFLVEDPIGRDAAAAYRREQKELVQSYFMQQQGGMAALGGVKNIDLALGFVEEMNGDSRKLSAGEKLSSNGGAFHDMKAQVVFDHTLRN
jgi:hypothetical protein